MRGRKWGGGGGGGGGGGEGGSGEEGEEVGRRGRRGRKWGGGGGGEEQAREEAGEEQGVKGVCMGVSGGTLTLRGPVPAHSCIRCSAQRTSRTCHTCTQPHVLRCNTGSPLAPEGVEAAADPDVLGVPDVGEGLDQDLHGARQPPACVVEEEEAGQERGFLQRR